MSLRSWWERRQERRFYKMLGKGDEWKGRERLIEIVREVKATEPQRQEEYDDIVRRSWSKGWGRR